MADTKTSGLTALSSGASASGDLLMLVDVSDTTMAGTGTNKKMTLNNFFGNLPVGVGFGDEEIDEYDEGTCTMTLTASSVSGSHTYSSQSGFYTRIGDICVVTFRCHVSSKDAAISGDIRISGLPFAAGSNASAAAMSFSLFNGLTWTGQIMGRVSNATTYIELRVTDNTTGTNTTITHADLNTPRFEGTVVYRV